VFGRFVELLSADRADYVDKLDYFEVRFDGALAIYGHIARDVAVEIIRKALDMGVTFRYGRALRSLRTMPSAPIAPESPLNSDTDPKPARSQDWTLGRNRFVQP
jgi:hypothetical protein